MSKYNVLYVESNVDGTVGGSYFSLLYLISTLDKKKYNPCVVFYRKNKILSRFIDAGFKVILFEKRSTVNLVKYIDIKNVKHLILRILSLPVRIIQIYFNVFIDVILPTFKCIKIIKSEKIDLVHLNNTILRPQEWILASLITHTKLVAHERGINTSIPLNSRLLAESFEAVICISKAVKNNLIRNCKISKRLHLVYNGLDPAKFKPTIEKEEIRRTIGLNDEDLVIGVVGNLKKWKGQDVVVRSIALIRKKFRNIKCLMIGSSLHELDTYSMKLQSLVQQKKLEENVIFLGYREDIQNYVNVLDILLHTSVFPEPFGRVMLEGMALSKPVITVDIGAGPEIVLHKKTGIVIKPNDERALSDAICFLLNNKSISKTMGLAGRERLQKHFHLHINTRMTELIYKNILES